MALGVAPADSGPLRRELAKLGENCAVRGALLGRRRRAVADESAPAPLEDLGAVVTGVNDAPPARRSPTIRGPPTPAQPVATVPLSAAALADQKARIARYGDRRAPIRASPASTRPPAPPARPRAFDASEGTPLDPLLNKTYDLNYAKTVPPLRRPIEARWSRPRVGARPPP